MNLWDLPRFEGEVISVFERRAILPSERKRENKYPMEQYVGDWVLWQRAVKAYREKVKVHVGN
jgi:hypothetical protein